MDAHISNSETPDHYPVAALAQATSTIQSAISSLKKFEGGDDKSDEAATKTIVLNTFLVCKAHFKATHALMRELGMAQPAVKKATKKRKKADEDSEEGVKTDPSEDGAKTDDTEKVAEICGTTQAPIKRKRIKGAKTVAPPA